MVPYIEDFYTRAEADELFEFIKSQPNVRPDNKRNKTTKLRRISYPGYSPSLKAAHHQASEYDVSGSVEAAPELYKKLADRITTYATAQGLPVPINYLSTIGYEVNDHMNFHQHKEDKVRADQTVCVLALGSTHPIAIRPLGCKDQRFYEYLFPKHGSLYVLPSSYNTTHEHAVLEGGDGTFGGLRLAINCKHIPAGLPEEEMRKACSRPAGGPGDSGPRIYDQHAGKSYPEGCVNVDRTTPFGNHNRHNLKTEEGRAAWAKEVSEKMQDAGFRAQVEALRGKSLLCWCTPTEVKKGWCHARAWLEIANAVKP